MLVIGNYIDSLKCESFLDPETLRIRVRPIKGQELPTTMVIECSKKKREAHSIGTLVKGETVKVCKKPDGRFFSRAIEKMIFKI